MQLGSRLSLLVMWLFLSLLDFTTTIPLIMVIIVAAVIICAVVAVLIAMWRIKKR